MVEYSLFTVGPSLKLNAQLTAGFELSLDMKVDLAYSIKNGVLVFPPDQGDSHGDFSPADTSTCRSEPLCTTVVDASFPFFRFLSVHERDSAG